ncbi:MAG: monovalent cation/H+ antiporter complex subunit F [Lachnospiraceae bacterium]
MHTGFAAIDLAYQNVFVVAIIILALFIVLCLIRAIIGPRVADRIVAVNMMGTMVMVIIAILALKMNESYLIDISLIYAMISFLAVIVVTKVYLGVYKEKKEHQQEQEGSDHVNS